MEPVRTRDVITTNPVTEPVVTETVDPAAVGTAPVAAREAVVVEHTRATQMVDVVTIRSVSPHAIVAGLIAIAMVVWGAVIMARTGLAGTLREPQASLLGLTGNALSGMLVAGLGLVLLLSAMSRDRAAITFSSIIIGIGAAVVIIEPDVADGALALDRAVPVMIAVGACVVALLAAAVPTMTSRTRTIDRV